MRELTCEICKNTFTSVKDLAAHIKKHRISQKRYFEQYFPRKDLFSSEKIQFKSLEQYFLSDFCDKIHLRSWLKSVDSEKAAQYLLKKLKTYCDIKKFDYAPSSSILQTIATLPSIKVFEYFLKNSYSEICRLAGVTPRFQYGNEVDILARGTELKQVVIDTREKKPIQFGKTVRKISIGLDYGDYALSPNSKTAIERKSFGDFLGTFSLGYERFCRELSRAKDNDGYIVIMVEATYSSLMYQNKRWGYANPEHVFHNLRDLYKKYDNFQLVFCDGRIEMKRIMPKILSLRENVKLIDLQYCLDKNLI